MNIYKITNLINKKIYIGQTIQSIETRWKQHIYKSKKSKLYFHNAIKKYGQDNFIIEIIETVNENDILFERENYWVEFFDARNPEIGYNIAKPAKAFWTGCHHTDKSKMKIQLARTGVKLSKETKVNYPRP